jgi:hypothetical protein
MNAPRDSGSTKLVYRSSDLEAKLRPLCEEVLRVFSKLPSPRLLCYFDDEDAEWLHREIGDFVAVHTPIVGSGAWPSYVEQFFLDSRANLAFDNLIYVPRTKYVEDRTSLVITFAHELQHFVRFANSRKVSRVNSLLHQHLGAFDPTTDIRPWGLPLNRDAMIVAKRVAEAVCGPEAVAHYMDSQIAEGRRVGNTSKVQMWQWAKSISPSSLPYDLCKETDRLVQRYKTQLLGLKSEIDFSVPEWWNFHRNDIFMHRSEGWYGIVEKHRGDNDGEDFYIVQTLEPRKFLRSEDMVAVKKEDIPFDFRDLRVAGRGIEKDQVPLDTLHDLVTNAVYELDRLAPSVQKKELGDLIFRARDVVNKLRTE